MKNLIFIFPYPITEWDAYRYGFNYLLEKNINLTVLNVSAIMSKDKSVKCNTLNAHYIKNILSYHDLEREISLTARNSVYIDCINGLNGLQWPGRKIFRLFKKYDVTYYLVEIGSLPILMNTDIKQLSKRIKTLFNYPKVINYTKWRLSRWIINFQEKYFSNQQLPKKIFVGQTELMQHYLRKYRLNSDIVKPIHSFDYDRYLTYQKACRKAQSDCKTAVFLDQALVSHRDFGVNARSSPVTSKNYYHSLNSFFDKLEQENDIKVVIAIHPRNQIDHASELFGKREVISGRVLELIHQCKVVMMHSSTAVSFAVLFDKPILILKTEEMRRSYSYNKFVDNIANKLHLTAINIDDANELSKFKLENHINRRRSYGEYKYSYVKTKGLADKTTWEFLHEELSKEYSYS